MRCPHCGNENPGDHRFCGMCGKPLPDPAAEIAVSKDDCEGLSRVLPGAGQTVRERSSQLCEKGGAVK